MREILFRGKRKDNGEWFYGDLLQNIDVIKIREQEKEIKYIARSFEVVPETIGQYTGLTDKNRTKIFEGDIVEVWYKQRTLENNTEPQKYKAIIVFGNPNCFYSWGYQLKMIDDFPYNNDILLWVEMEDTGAFVEVIGNIHDNPELLEVDNV
jgi:uncharacterized phage protein (TIGR01671 family)